MENYFCLISMCLIFITVQFAKLVSNTVLEL